MISIFLYLFSLNIILSSFFVILSTNPVYSILYLIFLILNTSGVLIILGSEFLAFLLVIIYVGAIAVLFLFVVMMLDIKLLEISNNFYKYFPIALIFSIILIIEFITYFYNYFNFIFIESNEKFITTVKNFSENLYFDLSSFYKQVQYFSTILYIDYFFLLILIGVLLLFSMIGVIIITLNKNIYLKRQDLYTQINKNVSDTLYLNNKNINKTFS